MALQPVTTDLGTTSHPVPIEKLASLDVVSWSEILSHKTVLQQGILQGTAERNTPLFSFDNAPLHLQSATHKTIIKHLAEMFAHWHGTMVFELVVSVPYFVATKIAFAFVPDATNPDQWPASSLAGFQNSVVFNPVNQSSVELRVPFISTTNWGFTNETTGFIVAKLLDPIVSSIDLSGGIPWTLFVSADPSDFAFRYVAPPLLQSFDSSNPGIKDEPTLADYTLARSMSTAPLSQVARATQSWPLVQQSPTNTRNQYETMMLIPRSRVEFVIQKVRGQFPSGVLDSNCVLNMFDVPTSSFSSYENTTPPSPYTLYPYLSQPFLVSYNTHHGNDPQPSSSPTPFQIVHAGDNLFLLFLVSSSSLHSLDRLSPSIWFNYRATIRGNKKWNYFGLFQFTQGISAFGRTYHVYKEGNYSQNAETIYFDNDLSVIEACACTWASSSGVSPAVSYVTDCLSQVESCPSTITHLALYTNMPPDLASTFTSWLVTSDNSSPPAEALHYSISFSPNQSALAFNDGRFYDVEEARGIVWRLFKLFKGDETKWWAWLVKGLDIVVDTLIGVFLGRAGTHYVVPIGAGSGFRAEAVGAYSESLISRSDPVPLEYIAPKKAISLVRFSMESQIVRPTPGASTAASPSVSRAVSNDSQRRHPSRKHRIHRARHPSKKHF